jgi:hypothetical protein
MALVAPFTRAQCGICRSIPYLVLVLDPLFLCAIFPAGSLLLGRRTGTRTAHFRNDHLSKPYSCSGIRTGYRNGMVVWANLSYIWLTTSGLSLDHPLNRGIKLDHVFFPIERQFTQAREITYENWLL